MTEPSNKSSFQVILCSPALHVGDPRFNSTEISRVIATERSIFRKKEIFLFPELSLTGFSCGDLFRQPLLQHAAFDALSTLEIICEKESCYAIVGLPLIADGLLFNAAALLGPKGLIRFSLQSHPERQGLGRWFSPASECTAISFPWGEASVPIARDAAFREPTWGPQLFRIVVGQLASAQLNPNAETIFNLRADLALALPYPSLTEPEFYSQNGSQIFSASAGPWESSSEGVFSGALEISSPGQTKARDAEISFETKVLKSDQLQPPEYLVCSEAFNRSLSVSENISQLPFINSCNTELQFLQVINIQAAALARRMRQIGAERVVLGISGGSDSSQALLVCVHAFRQMGLPGSNILAVSMPGSGSTAASQNRTNALVAASGATSIVIPIGNAVEGHLKDIGQPENLFDTTFENAQARERTQILMDLANKEHALMVGTGDMSEIALGWSTYNGDQMSFYNPNAGLPKTLLLRVLAWSGEYLLGEAGGKAARAVSEATITPELLPLKDGEQHQSTEEILGPYTAHDFFLYHLVYLKETPRQVYRAAVQAFTGLYEKSSLLKWLRTFCKRFFSQQFKRSASADGPQIVEFSLSPHGGWVLPSDASSALWLAELDKIEAELNAK